MSLVCSTIRRDLVLDPWAGTQSLPAFFTFTQRAGHESKDYESCSRTLGRGPLAATFSYGCLSAACVYNTGATRDFIRASNKRVNARAGCSCSTPPQQRLGVLFFTHCIRSLTTTAPRITSPSTLLITVPKVFVPFVKTRPASRN
jgi:hypothetical protein